MQRGRQGLRRHFHSPRKRAIDDHDDEEPAEDQSGQRSRHYGLGMQVVGREKSVKPTVMIAPPNRTNHITPGTTPAATTSRALRAWVTTSSCRRVSFRSTAPRRSVGLKVSSVE